MPIFPKLIEILSVGNSLSPDRNNSFQLLTHIRGTATRASQRDSAFVLNFLVEYQALMPFRMGIFTYQCRIPRYLDTISDALHKFFRPNTDCDHFLTRDSPSKLGEEDLVRAIHFIDPSALRES
jgi:hypothetical protein